MSFRVRDLGDGNLNPVSMLMRIVKRDCLRFRRCMSPGACGLFLAGLCGGLADAASKEQQHGSESCDPTWLRLVSALKRGCRAIWLDVVVDAEEVVGVILLLDRPQSVKVVTKLLLYDPLVRGFIGGKT